MMADKFDALAAASVLSGSPHSVKFRRGMFMELVTMARPRIIYRGGRMHFSFDGFVMYKSQCQDSYFGQRIVEAIEFSNQP